MLNGPTGMLSKDVTSKFNIPSKGIWVQQAGLLVFDSKATFSSPGFGKAGWVVEGSGVWHVNKLSFASRNQWISKEVLLLVETSGVKLRLETGRMLLLVGTSVIEPDLWD